MYIDPPCPADGSCVVCGAPREPNRSSKYGKAEAMGDPFCSSLCCRAWYGTTIRGRSGLGVTAPVAGRMIGNA